MPQEFQILRCYSCEKFQVHQTKKTTKWQCKVCGEKQSLKKAYFIGSARDCRTNVQQLNFEDGKRKLDSMLEQSNECSENLEENSFFESVAENYNSFDEYENPSEPLQKSLYHTPASRDHESNLWMPKKKQRCEQGPFFEICNKDVSICKVDKVCKIEQSKSKNLDTPFHEQSINFDVSFEEHSLNSPAYDTSRNTSVPCDLKSEDKNCLLFKPELPKKRSGVSKNRGFQLIMNAAKKLSVDGELF